MFSVFWPHTLSLLLLTVIVVFSRVRRKILSTLISRNVDPNFLLLQNKLKRCISFVHAALLSSVFKWENFHLKVFDENQISAYHTCEFYNDFPWSSFWQFIPLFKPCFLSTTHILSGPHTLGSLCCLAVSRSALSYL